MVASTVLPASSSIANIPALNFWTTLPITSMESSLGKFAPYQRLLPRRWPPPPPPPRFPPPPPRLAPPLEVLGRASLTFKDLPSKSVPFRPLIAFSASESTAISTNAKPLGCPESRSVTMLTRSTDPYDWNMERSESSVVPKLRLPTKMFFIQVLFLEVAEQLIAARIEQRAANRTVRDFAKIGVTDKRQQHGGTSGAGKQPFREAARVWAGMNAMKTIL